MTKIKIGSMHDDSTGDHKIVSAGGDSDVTFGAQHDRSKLTTHIFDLANPEDLPRIAQHLTELSSQVEGTSEGKQHPEDVAALKHAATSAADGDAGSVANSLRGIGKWVLETGTEIGKPVLTDFLKSFIQH